MPGGSSFYTEPDRAAIYMIDVAVLTISCGRMTENKQISTP